MPSLSKYLLFELVCTPRCVAAGRKFFPDVSKIFLTLTNFNVVFHEKNIDNPYYIVYNITQLKHMLKCIESM